MTTDKELIRKMQDPAYIAMLDSLPAHTKAEKAARERFWKGYWHILENTKRYAKQAEAWRKYKENGK